MRIAHTADIHIRSLARHDEYRHVFKEFTESCRRLNVDHIFVGGDIWHTKTIGISPEYIDLLTWWLKEMSTVAQVHLILGNHDLNLSNLSRQDAVTPIVDSLGHPRVKLYKTSGVYPIQDGFNLCVFSCADEPGWTHVRPVVGDVNVAAFHGPVRGSHTESGWDVSDGVDVSFFNDYDFTLLGDIHAPQVLKTRKDKPVIAYPGTLIQQGYGEQVEHSFLVWDIASRDDWSVETVSVPNERPYVTLDWCGDNAAVENLAALFPEGSRFRIRAKTQMTQDKVVLISNFLKTKLSASEVTFKIDADVDLDVISSGETVFSKTDLSSQDVLSRLVCDFYKNDAGFLSISDNVLEQLKSYLQVLKTSDDDSRGAKWSLKKLEWSNLFSYGESNVIDFDKLRGLIGILGPNRTGKSSIVGSLMYTLFNTTDRGVMKNVNICNVRKDACFGKAFLDYNGTLLEVERQTTKSVNKKGIVSAPTGLNVFCTKSGHERVDLCGEQRSDTDKVLRSLIGNADDFLLTSLSAQGESNLFFNQGSTKRRAVLSKLLSLDLLDKIFELASKDLSSIKSQLKNFKSIDWDTQLEEHRQHADELKKLLSEIDAELTSQKTTLKLLEAEFSKNDTIFVSKEDLTSQRALVDSLQSKSDMTRGEIDSLKKESLQTAEKIASLRQMIDSIDIKSLLKTKNALDKMKSSVEKLTHVHDKHETRVTTAKKSLKILGEVPCGNEYPTCKFIKDAHVTQASYPELLDAEKKSLHALRESQKELQDALSDFSESKIDKHASGTKLLSDMSFRAERLDLDIQKKEHELLELSSRLARETIKLQDIQIAFQNFENEHLVSVRNDIEKLTESIRDNDAKRLSVASKIGRLESSLDRLLQDKSSHDILLTSAKTRDYIVGAFSKKSIPLSVLRSQIPIINKEVSHILQGIVDFTVEIEVDEESDTLEIYINYGDSRRIIELCSGMEKTISSLALRVAMINISTLPKSDIFIIDEGFGTLDENGVDACSRLLRSLKRFFKSVLVITHVDGIKDSLDHVLEVSKVEKDSRIVA